MRARAERGGLAQRLRDVQRADIAAAAAALFGG
jgi:hypothetical protein